MGDFSACPSCGRVHEFSEESDQMNKLAERTDLNAQAIIEKMVSSVKGLLDDVGSFDEFERRLPELYGELSDDELAEQIEWATLLARLKGMDSV